MTNTISVPRELLENIVLCYNEGEFELGTLAAECHALLSAPSPAGVGGCRCSMSISMLGDGCRHCQPQEYIDRLGEMLDEERSELSDAQAIIDGLRGEVAQLQSMLATVSKAGIRIRTERDQQAQRIGELEPDAMRYQHLRASFVRGHSHDLRWFLRRTTPLTAEGLDKDIDAALSAGKEQE